MTRSMSPAREMSRARRKERNYDEAWREITHTAGNNLPVTTKAGSPESRKKSAEIRKVVQVPQCGREGKQTTGAREMTSITDTHRGLALTSAAIRPRPERDGGT